jgi:hypothetical protein
MSWLYKSISLYCMINGRNDVSLVLRIRGVDLYLFLYFQILILTKQPTPLLDGVGCFVRIMEIIHIVIRKERGTSLQ